MWFLFRLCRCASLLFFRFYSWGIVFSIVFCLKEVDAWMSETRGVIKKNGTINPNRENLSFVKNLSHNVCDCGTSVFTRELPIPICASPYRAASGSQHPAQSEQHSVRACSRGRQLAIFYEEVCCEKCRYLQSYLRSTSTCIAFAKAMRTFPMEQCIRVYVPTVICVSPLKPYWWNWHHQTQLAYALRKRFIFN